MVQNNTSRKSGPWTRSKLQLLVPWWGKVARIYKSSDCNCMFIIKVQLFYIATGRFTFAIAKFTNFMATPPGFGFMSSSTFYARRLKKYWNNNYKLKKKKKCKITACVVVPQALLFCFLLHLKTHSIKILIYNWHKTQPNPIQKNFCLFPHNTHYRLLSAKLETNTHCWTQFLPLLPSAACIPKRTNETAQWSVQFIAINLHIYRERSDVSLSLLSPRLGGSWQLPARQPLMLTANQAEAAGCLVLLWQRDNSELLLAWKRQYSEEKEETEKKAADSRE